MLLPTAVSLRLPSATSINGVLVDGVVVVRRMLLGRLPPDAEVGAPSINGLEAASDFALN